MIITIGIIFIAIIFIACAYLTWKYASTAFKDWNLFLTLSAGDKLFIIFGLIGLIIGDIMIINLLFELTLNNQLF